MSLVAYEASSDEESDCEGDGCSKAIIVANTVVVQTPQLPPTGKVISNGHISDDDEELLINVKDKEEDLANSLSKLLPRPKNDKNLLEILENLSKPTFTALPTPKGVDAQIAFEEADDEFLHKKPSQEMIEKPNKNIEVKKMPVKITVPSLSNFKDVDKEAADKAKSRDAIKPSKISGSSGLLSLLPKAKSEQNFAKNPNISSKNNETLNTVNTGKVAIPSFIPDSVKHRRPATNTEDVERLKPNKKKISNQANKTILQSNIKTDSDESDDDTVPGDFFSFNTDESLPEVSATEINALVAKKVAKIHETTSNYLKTTESQKIQSDENEFESHGKRFHQEDQLNSEALQVLVGGSAKRRRQEQSDIHVIDINSSQVMPNKEEWMRTALASSTAYQPTGVLVDEEPASGTRRKHQITYLAHKAKANEAELQAMWASNRQNRRATQSKYGF